MVGQQSSTDEIAQRLNFRGIQKHEGKQTPRQKSFADESCGWRLPKLFELFAGPIGFAGPFRWHLLLECFPGSQQTRVFRILGNQVELGFPSQVLNVIFVSQNVNEALRIKLWATCTSKDLLSRTRFDNLLLSPGTLDHAWEDNAAGWKIDACGQSLGADANAEQLLLKKLLHDPSVLWHQACVVHTDSSDKDLFELWPSSLGKIICFDAFGKDCLPFLVD